MTEESLRARVKELEEERDRADERAAMRLFDALREELGSGEETDKLFKKIKARFNQTSGWDRCKRLQEQVRYLEERNVDLERRLANSDRDHNAGDRGPTDRMATS